MKSTYTLLTLAALITFPTYAETRQAGAHVHGINQVQLLQDGQEIRLIYSLPVAQLSEEKNQMEHEHEHEQPDHQDDKLKVSLESLRDGSSLFSLSGAGAKCELSNYSYSLREVVTGLDDSHGGHKDAILEYSYQCENAEQLSALQLSAFDRFETLESIDFEGLIQGQAITERIKRSQTRIEF